MYSKVIPRENYNEKIEESKNEKSIYEKLESNTSNRPNSQRSCKEPITIRENFANKNSEEKIIANDIEKDNKDNDVILCISSLDVKIDESNIISNNLNEINKNQNSFLNNLNIKPNKMIMVDLNTEETKQQINQNINKNSDSSNNFLENTFENIKFNLNKIKSNREKIYNVKSNNVSNNLTENSFKVSKLEIGNSADNTNRSKSILSARFNKILQQNTVETEYLETEENFPIIYNKKKKYFLAIILVLICSALLGLLAFILLSK